MQQKRPFLLQDGHAGVFCAAEENNDVEVQCYSDYEVQKRRRCQTALILTPIVTPPIAGSDYGLIQKVMMGRKKWKVGREDWMEEMVALSPDSDSPSSHSTVVMLKRTNARASREPIQ